jgi:hypothetical protein
MAKRRDGQEGLAAKCEDYGIRGKRVCEYLNKNFGG